MNHWSQSVLDSLLKADIDWTRPWVLLLHPRVESLKLLASRVHPLVPKVRLSGGPGLDWDTYRQVQTSAKQGISVFQVSCSLETLVQESHSSIAWLNLFLRTLERPKQRKRAELTNETAENGAHVEPRHQVRRHRFRSQEVQQQQQRPHRHWTEHSCGQKRKRTHGCDKTERITTLFWRDQLGRVYMYRVMSQQHSGVVILGTKKLLSKK